MSIEEVKVCDLPEDEKRRLLELFQTNGLTGSPMRMTKTEIENLVKEKQKSTDISDDSVGETAAEEEKEEDNSENTQVENKNTSTVVEALKIEHSEPVKLKCPRCYSPMDGNKCNCCGYKVGN